MEIIDFAAATWRDTHRAVANDATVRLELGDYGVDVSGDFSAGLLTLRATDGSVIAVWDAAEYKAAKLQSGDYHFIVTGTIAGLGITIRRFGLDTTGGFALGATGAPRPARMTDAFYMSRWFDRHRFAQAERRREVTPGGPVVAEECWQGTLTPDAATEIIERHQPPLAVTPETVATEYQPKPGATITVSHGGHVFDGAAVLAGVVARNLTVRVTFVVE